MPYGQGLGTAGVEHDPRSSRHMRASGDTPSPRAADEPVALCEPGFNARNRPFLAKCHHPNTTFAFTPCARATSVTDAPALRVSSRIRSQPWSTSGEAQCAGRACRSWSRSGCQERIKNELKMKWKTWEQGRPGQCASGAAHSPRAATSRHRSVSRGDLTMSDRRPGDRAVCLGIGWWQARVCSSK